MTEARTMTMKIATVGKGGSGKTTIAGVLSRIFAKRDFEATYRLPASNCAWRSSVNSGGPW